MSSQKTQVSLQSLKDQQLVWQGHSGSQQEQSCLSSGYSAFDQALSGGWPASGVVELSPASPGIGELRLILPVVSALAATRPLQAWVAAPACLTPHNLSLESLERCLLVRPPEKYHYWALEQLLASGCCSTVVSWVGQLSLAQARRLQVAARESATLVFLIRRQADLSQSLPVSLRLRLDAAGKGLSVAVFKRQHGWPLEPFKLDLSERFPQLFEQDQPVVTQLAPDNVLPFALPQAGREDCSQASGDHGKAGHAVSDTAQNKAHSKHNKGQAG